MVFNVAKAIYKEDSGFEKIVVSTTLGSVLWNNNIEIIVVYKCF